MAMNQDQSMDAMRSICFVHVVTSNNTDVTMTPKESSRQLWG
jgi:hypothetical protein